jgi:hypothetical protein
MKNQYFGDVNDYRKYGLLRTLTATGQISTAVCWMLTPDDSSSDGRFIDYLKHPETWRHFDPELFDQLKQIVLIDGVRNVEMFCAARNPFLADSCVGKGFPTPRQHLPCTHHKKDRTAKGILPYEN